MPLEPQSKCVGNGQDLVCGHQRCGILDSFSKLIMLEILDGVHVLMGILIFDCCGANLVGFVDV